MYCVRLNCDTLVTLEHEVWRAKHKSFQMLRKVLAVLVPWSGTGSFWAIGFWNQCAWGAAAGWMAQLPTLASALCQQATSVTQQNSIFMQVFLFLRDSLNKWREVFLSGKAQCLENPDSHNRPKSFAASCLPHSCMCKKAIERTLETDTWELKENSNTIYR